MLYCNPLSVCVGFGGICAIFDCGIYLINCWDVNIWVGFSGFVHCKVILYIVKLISVFGDGWIVGINTGKLGVSKENLIIDI